MNIVRGSLNFSSLLEGFVKFNLLLLSACLALFYMKKLEVRDYFYFMKEQILLLLFVSIVAKCYERIKYKVPFRELSVRKSSIFHISLFAIIFLYFFCLVFKHLPLNLGVFYSFLYHIILAITYWFVIVILYRSNFMKKFIGFLKTCLEYKDIMKLFLIFNIVFSLFILALVITVSRDRDILETIFIILYFEISFFIFHLVVAYLVDFVWLPGNRKRNNISLFGVCVGSIIYVLKFNIIDKKLIGLSTQYDKFLLTAIVSLMLFWIFFTLLFHLEWKNMLKTRIMD